MRPRIPDFIPCRRPNQQGNQGGGRKRLPESGSFIRMRLETSFMEVVTASAAAQGVGRQEFLRAALAAFLDAADADPNLPIEARWWWRKRVMTPVSMTERSLARARALVTSSRAESVTDVVRAAGLWAAELAAGEETAALPLARARALVTSGWVPAPFVHGANHEPQAWKSKGQLRREEKAKARATLKKGDRP